jgi:3',5'-cyclic AMP phosphodiesterase CpdA
MTQHISNPTAGQIRLAHFSDIHVTAPDCRWRAEDWFNKRLTSWVNLRLLGRGYRFRHADQVVAALAADLAGRCCDRLIFSGDATALGFEEEVARAAALLGVGRPGWPVGLAVPGNHDYCTVTAAGSGCFERHFAPWLAGERVGKEIYPYAQQVGPVWLVAVNSATANRWAWDARGAVGRDQLERLDRLLTRLPDGPRILVTHYPIMVASGRNERRVRELRDLDDVLAVARRGGVRLWLHGHRHGPYHHPASDQAPFPVVCAGSATQHGLWSYAEHTLTTGWLRVQRRVYDPGTDRFRDGEAFELELPA